MIANSPSERGQALAAQLLAEGREELNRADNKASMLFAIFGVGFGAVLAGVIAGDWNPDDLSTHAEIVWWVGAAAAVAGLVAVGAAVWPRVGSKQASGRVTYFAHVTSYPTVDALREAIEHEAGTDGARTLDQLQAISGLVMRKYRLIRFGMALYAGGAIAFLLASLAS